MKRAKETTKNNKGKFNKKKRFGKSIKNRCPGGFQTTIEKKFEVSGGRYIEVASNYRAMYHLVDGTLVQRDWYSSFLLYCYDDKIEEINKTKCRTEFEKHYKREKALIEWIQANQIKILNSGIKTA